MSATQCKMAPGTPKNGSGDGQKLKKRVPVSSARKFNARAPPMEEFFKIKLENSLNEMLNERETQEKLKSKPLKKARSVAEIKPSKSKVKRPLANVSSSAIEASSTVTLYATPRPLDDLPTVDPRQKILAARRVFERLLLNAWRRSKARLSTLDEASKRQAEQINQLELQVDLLRNLSKSERTKRDEALNESQRVKNTLEFVEQENASLNKTLFTSKIEMEYLQKNLKSARTQLKICSEKLEATEIVLNEQTIENQNLKNQVKNHEDSILKLNLKLEEFDKLLKQKQEMLNIIEICLGEKCEAYSNLFLTHEQEVEGSFILQGEVETLKHCKTQLEIELKDLQETLNKSMFKSEFLEEENESMRVNMEEIHLELSEERKRSWWKNTKEFATLTLATLDKMAYIMLPAYIKEDEDEDEY